MNIYIYKQAVATRWLQNISVIKLFMLRGKVGKSGTRTCYFELRRLASIRRSLTSTATATLVSAFVLSIINYCNSLLFGSTHDVTSHFQRI